MESIIEPNNQIELVIVETDEEKKQHDNVNSNLIIASDSDEKIDTYKDEEDIKAQIVDISHINLEFAQLSSEYC